MIMIDSGKTKLDSIIIVNDFDEESVLEFRSDVERVLKKNTDTLKVIIDSYGGEIYSAFAMLDILKNVEKPVETCAIGKAMSCGAMLLICGGTPGYRCAGELSTIMLHEISGTAEGKMQDIVIETEEYNRLNKIMLEYIDVATGSKIGRTKSLLQKKVGDWYISPKEAVKYKFIDKIGVF